MADRETPESESGTDRQGRLSSADVSWGAATKRKADCDAQDRAAADEAAADQARLGLHLRNTVRPDPDDLIRPVMGPDEELVAVRRSALMQVSSSPELPVASPVVVDVYVTSRRLVLLGPETLAIDLATVDEAVVSRDRLLLVLCDGVGLALEVDWPRLLRVEIAAARAARR
jgi:hypothetical protein